MDLTVKPGALMDVVHAVAIVVQDVLMDAVRLVINHAEVNAMAIVDLAVSHIAVVEALGIMVILTTALLGHALLLVIQELMEIHLILFHMSRDPVAQDHHALEDASPVARDHANQIVLAHVIIIIPAVVEPQ